MEPSFRLGTAHIGPVDVTRLDVDDDAVGKGAVGRDDLAVRAVRIHREDAAAARSRTNSRPVMVDLATAGRLVWVTISVIYHLCLTSLPPYAA